MTSLLLPPFATLFDFSFPPHLIAIIVPIACLIFAGIIVISSMYFQNQRRQMWHDTARLALEKGQPLPAPVEDSPRDDRRWMRDRSDHRCDLRRGIILVAVGAGLFFFLGGIGGNNVARVGAIPGFIGLALILFSILGGSRRSDRSAAPDDRTPRT